MESGCRNNIDRANTIPICTKCKNITIGDECQYIMECQHFSYFSNRFNITNIREKTKILKTRRVGRYQMGNQNPYIEEEQTTQWSKEKVQKDKQRST